MSGRKPFKGKLQLWSIRSMHSPYQAPEVNEMYCRGKLPGMDLESDEWLSTSAIVKIDLPKRRIETRNSIYSLGRMHPDYAAWMEAHGFTLAHFARRFEERAKQGINA